MGNRRVSRECALQLLYQKDVSGGKSLGLSEDMWRENDATGDVRDFALTLYRGVCDHLVQLDDLITQHSTHWKVSRMAAVDKNILRIGAYELLHCSEIPIKATINEAVEIAKRFGTAESSSFVNGILDSLAKSLEKNADES
ncbi:MAG: transcription antitermination factor NusB [Deltaproteobacteria bacterium]|nr:transcription antitermination factor NusB [Deltaproteobacteria bacterium]